LAPKFLGNRSLPLEFTTPLASRSPEFDAPVAIEFPTLRTAPTGAVMAPNNPFPTPLKKPLAPLCFAPFKGFAKIPENPSYRSVAPPFTP